MIIFLYGRDGYRLKQNVQKIIDGYRKKHASGMSLTLLDFDGEPSEKIEQLKNVIKTISFFSEKKLIKLANTFPVSDSVIRIVKDYDLIGDKQIIMVVAENETETELNKKNKKYFSFLAAKPNVSKSFGPLSGRQLENWIIKEADLASIEIEQKTARKLTEMIGNDSWALKQEIDKIANYCQAIDKKTASMDEINSLVSGKIDLNIFETIDALAGKNRGRAAFLLNRHLASGEDPHYLFSMIVYQFRNLLKVKSISNFVADRTLSADNIAKKSGLHPFVARKMLEQSKKYNLDELKQKFLELAEKDVEIKNSQIDIVDCLYQIALG